MSVYGGSRGSGLTGNTKVLISGGTMEQVFGDIRFDRCPTTGQQMLAVREAVDAML